MIFLMYYHYFSIFINFLLRKLKCLLLFLFTFRESFERFVKFSEAATKLQKDKKTFFFFFLIFIEILFCFLMWMGLGYKGKEIIIIEMYQMITNCWSRESALKDFSFSVSCKFGGFLQAHDA